MLLAKRFALVIGIVYLLVGIVGFIPGFVVAEDYGNVVIDASEGRLLGIFPVNVLHHVVHLLVGVLGLAASRSFEGSRAFARGLAIFYGLLAVMGLIPAAGLDVMFGLVPIFSHDVWLHAVTALAAAYVGWVAARDENAATVV
jgi:hypothetical protein